MRTLLVLLASLQPRHTPPVTADKAVFRQLYTAAKRGDVDALRACQDVCLSLGPVPVLTYVPCYV